jgi:hypothetical protein
MIGLGPDPAIRGAAYVYSEDRRGEHAIRGDASKKLWANRLPVLRGSFLNNSEAFAGGTRTTVLLQ